MTDATEPASTGGIRTAPTTTSEARGSVTIAARKWSCRARSASTRLRSGSAVTSGKLPSTSRVGSPPVCESTYRMRFMSNHNRCPPQSPESIPVLEPDSRDGHRAALAVGTVDDDLRELELQFFGFPRRRLAVRDQKRVPAGRGHFGEPLEARAMKLGRGVDAGIQVLRDFDLADVEQARGFYRTALSRGAHGADRNPELMQRRGDFARLCDALGHEVGLRAGRLVLGAALARVAHEQHVTAFA